MRANRVAVITGGAGGIGASISRRMVRDGLTAVLLDCNAHKAQSVARSLCSDGGEAIAISCDVTQPESVDAAFDQAMDRCGRIDVLAHNVGTEDRTRWMDTPLEDWKKLFAVNCDGMFLCVQRAAREMVKAQIRGKIILTLGQAAYGQDAAAALYHTAKWAGRGFMRNAALALAPYGITVNGVCPGAVWGDALKHRCETFISSGAGTQAQFVQSTTQQYPLGRLQTGDDVAAMYSFLVREGHCITGQSLLVAGGAAFA